MFKFYMKQHGKVRPPSEELDDTKILTNDLLINEGEKEHVRIPLEIEETFA